MKGLPARPDSACSACAASSLPVPVSPVTSTGSSTGANLCSTVRTACSAGLSPINARGPSPAQASSVGGSSASNWLRIAQTRSCRPNGRVNRAGQCCSTGNHAAGVAPAPGGSTASQGSCRCCSLHGASSCNAVASRWRRSSTASNRSRPRSPIAMPGSG
ncbi:hypothetical protein G6F24_016673 [Rhizopus arrhizus]|nr:hypothetical protein G6F24_016673 [Rhizopus arrhizus]